MDEFEGAIADFTHALKVHPTFAQCHLWRGFAQLRSGNFQQAAGDLSRAIEAIPTCAEAYNHRGIARFYLNKFAAAIADFDQAIRLNPKFADGKFDQAHSDFDAAIAHSSDYGAVYGDRAYLRFKLGDWVGAIADTDQALALATSHGQQLKDIYATRCLTAFCLKESTQGLQAFEQLIALISAQ